MKNTEFTTLDKKLFTDKTHKNCFKFSDLTDQKINREMYFSAGAFPYAIINDDWKLGSIFENFYIPSGSYTFNKDMGWQKDITTLHIKDYEDILYNEIKKTVQEAYSTNKQVNLMFSGGIDSLVVASYIIAMGLENKTNFVTLYDYNQTDKYCMVKDEKLRLTLESFFKTFKNCQDWIKVNVFEEDLIDACNTKIFDAARSFTSYKLFNRFEDQVFIGGHYGNSTLYHGGYGTQIDEMLLQNPAIEKDLERIFNLPGIYCISNKTGYINHKRPQSDKHYVKKRTDFLNGINNNEIKFICGSDRIFEKTRQVDWSTWTDPYELVNACIARRIIQKNVGNLFDNFIRHENLLDADAFVDKNLPYESLNKSIFELPNNVHHNTQGVVWFAEEIKRAKNTGYIKTNTIFSMLGIWEISNTINTLCANT